jgi:hypothetical protein
MTEFMLRDVVDGKRVDVISPVPLDADDFAGLDQAVQLVVADDSLYLSPGQARALGLALLKGGWEAE